MMHTARFERASPKTCPTRHSKSTRFAIAKAADAPILIGDSWSREIVQSLPRRGPHAFDFTHFTGIGEAIVGPAGGGAVMGAAIALRLGRSLIPGRREIR